MNPHPLSPGDAGTWQTVDAMRRLVYEAAADPFVRAWGVEIVRQVQPRDAWGQIAAIRAFLAARVLFLDDPVGVELVHAPRALLAEIEARYLAHGDCDDVATLGAALGAVVGVPSRFVLLGFGAPGAPFAHVYAELWAALPNGGRWVDLDTTAQMPQHEREAIISRRQIVPAYPVEFVPP